MGKILQIRVSASTYDEDEVRKEWPSLWKIAWQDASIMPDTGVMSLAKAVADNVRAGLLSDEHCKALQSGSEKLEKLRLQLEKALNARNPKEADTLSYELEDLLSELEEIASDF